MPSHEHDVKEARGAVKQKQMTAVAIGCGLTCAVCVGAFMASVQGQADAARAEALARYGGEQVEVCVATRDIAAGERVDLSAVESKLWVADLLPENALRTTGDAVGHIATSSILKGEVVSVKRFENTRDALDVPAGKEAVSVPAKAVQAVGGAVRPGMSVDVYSAGDSTTVLIAHGVLVLATSVGESGSLVSSDSGWITLAVDPANVQEIIAASNRTNLHFVIPGEQLEGEPATQSGDAESPAGSPAGSPAENPGASAQPVSEASEKASDDSAAASGASAPGSEGAASASGEEGDGR